MKKSRKPFLNKYIRFRGRMLLILVIGGIIPFFGATIYMNSKAMNIVQKQNREAQQQELKLMGDFIQQAVPDMYTVSQNIYVSGVLPNMIQKEYTDRTEWQKDEEVQDNLGKYLKFDQYTISDIIVYVNNETIYYYNPFAYLGPSITNEKWYADTCAAGGEPYWCFGVDRAGKQKCIQLCRQILSAQGETLGILAVQMNMELLTNVISEREEDTILLFNDSETIYANYSMDKGQSNALANQLKSRVEFRNSIRYDALEEDKLLTYEKIHPMGTSGYYTIASTQEYSEINEGINRITLISYVVVGVGLFISFVMILLYSTSLSYRLKTLRRQMHLVATGRYEKVRPITGNDEIAEIYQELELMMGDIQELTGSMIEEKVQKEKMHTRQKEVEFKMLASQINPHFLYNTLETIRMKARVNHQPEIEELVKMLAKIMRRNIQVGHQMVSIRSEIELIENYLKIQSFRFGDRIRSTVTVEDNVSMEQEVMPLIIQPFVENAFIHGLEDMTGDGQLTVHVSQNDKDIVIEIIDNGVGMNYYQLAELRHTLSQGEQGQTHIGINNVNQRLIMQYGKEYAVQIESASGKGTKVMIRVPLTRNEED
ncbi:MAG: sensor histidine kinase [Lachnospiraceae bacterium]|nr:sensor histidine kinase [Lachnospiraceae bacterium]